MDFIKRELYNQIKYSQKQKATKKQLRQQVNDMEEELDQTITSYKRVLAFNETDLETDHGKAKHELKQMTEQIAQLEKER